MKKLYSLLLLILGLLSYSLNAQTTTWTGAISNDWEDPGNWDNGAPDATYNVIIDPSSNDPIIQTAAGSPAECVDLTINTGATLTLQNYGALNIYGDVTNSGSIIITGYGNFYQGFGSNYSGTGSFSLSRTGTSDPLKFNMWSSPVAAQNVSAMSGNSYSFNPATSTSSTADDATYPYDPGWVAASGNMTVGKGYACAGCGTVTFSGTPNNGNISIPVSYHSGPGVPYNLIGNPYPSPLDIYYFLGNVGNTNELATVAIYMWDNPASEPYSTSDYATINQSGTILLGGQGTYSSPYSWIPTGQGFFVEVDDPAGPPDGDIDFDNSMRADGSQDNNSQFYKQAIMQRLWLGVSDKDSTVYNEILVAFTDSATLGFDKKYDAKKLAGNTNLSLYSLNNNLHYAIQGLPYLTTNELEVPVGVSLDNNNTVTFALKWEEELQDFDIYLNDKQTGELIDLRNENYTLSIPSGEHNARFSLVLTPKNATGISEQTADALRVTHSNGLLQISGSNNHSQLLERVIVFDVTGKKMQEWNRLSLNNMETISLPFAPEQSGYYFVNISGENESVQEKIRIIN